MVSLIKVVRISLLSILLTACAVYPAHYGYYSAPIMPRSYTVIERDYFQPRPFFGFRRYSYGYGYPRYFDHFHEHRYFR